MQIRHQPLRITRGFYSDKIFAKEKLNLAEYKNYLIRSEHACITLTE